MRGAVVRPRPGQRRQDRTRDVGSLDYTVVLPPVQELCSVFFFG